MSKDDTSKKSSGGVLWNGGSVSEWPKARRQLQDEAMAEGFYDHLVGTASLPGLEPTFEYVYDGNLPDGLRGDSEAGAAIKDRVRDFRQNPSGFEPAYRRMDKTYSTEPDLVYRLPGVGGTYPAGLPPPGIPPPRRPVVADQRSGTEQKSAFDDSIDLGEDYETVTSLAPPDVRSPEGLLYSFPVIITADYSEYVFQRDAVKKEVARWRDRKEKYNHDLQIAIGKFSAMLGPRAKVFIHGALIKKNLSLAWAVLQRESCGRNVEEVVETMVAKFETLSMSSWRDFPSYLEQYEDLRLILIDLKSPLPAAKAKSQLMRAVSTTNCEEFKYTMAASRGNRWSHDETISALHEDYQYLRQKDASNNMKVNEYDKFLKPWREEKHKRTEKQNASAKTVTVTESAEVVSDPKAARKTDRSMMVCWNCDEVGHAHWECKATTKKDGSPLNPRPPPKVGPAPIPEEVVAPKPPPVPRPPASAKVLTTMKLNKSSGPIGDTGASNHIVGTSEGMRDYRAETTVINGFDDTELREAIGVGTIGDLRNALHLPDLKQDLISLGQLDREGYTGTLGEGTLRLWKTADHSVHPTSSSSWVRTITTTGLMCTQS